MRGKIEDLKPDTCFRKVGEDDSYYWLIDNDHTAPFLMNKSSVFVVNMCTRKLQVMDYGTEVEKLPDWIGCQKIRR